MAVRTDQENQAFQDDIDVVSNIPAVSSILEMVCRTTGMGFAAVARVTEDRWIACSTKDTIGFGLRPGGELKVDTTICHRIQQDHRPVVIGHVSENTEWRDHPTPAIYAFESYISVPILLPDGSFFGTLSAIDPEPRAIERPEVIGSLTLFAELIAFHLDTHRRIRVSEKALINERETATLREQFIAVLGHDLRNPLQAVLAGTQSMLRHPSRATEIARHVESSIARMAELVDNTMDFAKGRLGSGLTMALEENADIEPTLEQVIDELQSARMGQVIMTTFALQEPVCCDRARIAQVLSNLLGNALAHGKVGAPVQVEAQSGSGIFALSVTNTGKPIPPTVLPKLFQPFFRGGHGNPTQGLGLGLYIASEIARAHGGVVTATSDADRTRFLLQIPSSGP